jgi:hypothetical protein
LRNFPLRRDVKECPYLAIMIRCTRYNIMWKCGQWFATGRLFSPGTLVSSTNKTDHHDITEILLKVVLSTINQAKPKSTLTTQTCKVFVVVVKWICWYARCLHRLIHTVFYYESYMKIMFFLITLYSCFLFKLLENSFAISWR